MLKARTCWLFIGLAIQGLVAGCATTELWEEGKFAKFNEPARPPEFRLYSSAQRQDVLVHYVEERENGSRQWRAYWLNQNVARLRSRARPRFVSLQIGPDLTIVPVYATQELSTLATRPEMYALLASSPRGFSLYSGDRQLGAFELPVYEDSSGVWIQVLLTPFTLVADAAVIGCMVFIITLPWSAYAIAEAAG